MAGKSKIIQEGIGALSNLVSDALDVRDLDSFKAVDAQLNKTDPSEEQSFYFGADSLLQEMSEFMDRYLLSGANADGVGKLISQQSGGLIVTGKQQL